MNLRPEEEQTSLYNIGPQLLSALFFLHMNRFAFYCLCALLALGSFLLQHEVSLKLPVIADEFDGAYDVYRLSTELPYKDYRPYKTVLGYYIQLPALLLGEGAWQSLLNVRLQMAVINALLLFAAGIMLARLFGRVPALLSLLLWITMSTWLERSAELRVDTLTAWPGLFSFLFLLNGKIRIAGLLAGLSFIISQKGIYYLIAANCALIPAAVLTGNTRGLFRTLLRINTAAGGLIFLYLTFWSSLSDPASVFRATFLSHQDIVFGKTYDIHEMFWEQTLSRNPLFYLLSIGGIVLLLFPKREPDSGRYLFGQSVMPACYGAAIWALGLLHRQPWPYFFVILIPTFAVLNAAAIKQLIKHRENSFARDLLLLSLGASLTFSFQRIYELREITNEYQKQNVLLGQKLLKSGDTYLAGFDIFPVYSHPDSKLRRLSKQKREMLKSSSADELADILTALEQEPPTFILNNYRLHDLPEELKEYFQIRYERLWGEVHHYAPLIAPGEKQSILRAGDYRVELPAEANLRVNGETVEKHEHVSLNIGDVIEADTPLRLRPILSAEIIAELPSDQSEGESFFGNFYSY